MRTLISVHAMKSTDIMVKSSCSDDIEIIGAALGSASFVASRLKKLVRNSRTLDNLVSISG